MNFNEITSKFNKVPAVVKWAEDKVTYAFEEATSDFPYNKESYKFTGSFNGKTAPKEFLEQVCEETQEFVVSVAVSKGKYAGKKSHVSINVVRYFQ